MGCGKSKIYSAEIEDFTKAIKTPVDLTKFQKNMQAADNVHNAWASAVYGGSVLQPLATKDKKRTKYNPLTD